MPDLIVRPGPSGTRLYRVITDYLGSPIYVVNIADANDVLLDATYDEWGNVTAFTSSTGGWPIPFGFAGGLYDEDTGLVRFGTRDYDPRIGRWTSKDPIRWEGGQANLYLYAGNDSMNSLDPTGTVALLATAALGAGIGALIGGAAAALTGGDVAAGIAAGAVTGGLAGLTGGMSLAGQAIGGIGSAFVGLSVSTGVKLINGSPPPTSADVIATGLGGAVGPIVGQGLRMLTQPGMGEFGGFATRRLSGSIISAGVGVEARFFLGDADSGAQSCPTK